MKNLHKMQNAKMNKGRKIIIGFLMVLLMFFVATPDRVIAGMVNTLLPWQNLQLRGDLVYNSEYSHEIMTLVEKRELYQELREGNYSNYELKQKLIEYFGAECTGEYIYYNYKDIFGLEEDEVIDEAFLRVISGYVEDFSTQKGGSNNSIEKLFSDSGYIERPESEEQFLEQMLKNISAPELFFNYNSMTEANMPEGAQVYIAGSLASITYVSRNNTSITFDIWYASGDDANNYLAQYDFGSNECSFLLGQGKSTATSRRYTASGLAPGLTYMFEVGGM